MEDRNTPGLYLEMTNGPIEDYVGHRVPLLHHSETVERATWWENVHRDRDDLPRVLDEFTYLAVYEVTNEFVAPATPPDVTGYHFRRYPRPAQGRLTGRETIGLSLVLISPRDPADAQALRDWGDFVHLRHIAEVAVPGYTMITPYENATGTDPRYLHFYEMDTDDPEGAFKAMTPRVTELLGADTDAWHRWARHPALRIMYVNTFRRLGVR